MNLDLESFNQIINKKKKRSAPGNDNITYDMLNFFKNDTKISIVDQLNKIWKECYLPMSLKTITVIAIPKPGKDQSSIEGKRPISLVPTLTKIMNSAVLNKMIKFIDEKNIVPATSFGFRKNTSTVTCTNFLINTIKENKRKNYITAVIFMDKANAFNAVNVDTLLDIMENNRFPAEIT